MPCKSSGGEFRTVVPATEKHGFQTCCGEHVEQTLTTSGRS